MQKILSRVNDKSKVILKIDIQGYEYKIIDQIVDNFHQINMLLVQFYWINKNEEIFVESSNIGTIKMIRNIGKELQQEYLSQLGLLRQVNIGIPEKAIPIVPDPWRTVNTESISYGYGLSVSPLHLAVATSAVVNGGYLIKPSLTKLGDDKRYENQIFSEETSEIMRYLLSQVVAKGTAKEAFNKDADKAYTEDGKFKYLVGGKTGTSHKIDKKSYTREKLTTFISVLPIHKPKYVVLISLDDPKGINSCLLYTSPSPRDGLLSRMPSSA